MSHDSRPSQIEGAPGKPGQILLAEDDPEMRRLVADALRRIGHRVIEASTGTELLRLMVGPANERDSGPEDVDLIVTDVRMPGGSGLDVVEVLRVARLRTPVIFMTAFGDSETRARVERLGAILLDKPFRIDRLVQAVREALV